MPRRARKSRPARFPRFARKQLRRSKVPRGLGLRSNQMARITETVEFNDIVPNTAYNFNFNLSQFRRASTIAGSFKFYRATRVIWRMEPLYNTYQISEGTAFQFPTIPYLYSLMNRTQDTTGINLLDIQAAGAKPKKFSKTVTMGYKPNWCSPGLIGVLNQATTASVGLRTNYGWLASPDSFVVDSHGQVILNAGLTITPASASAVQNSVALEPVNVNQVIYNGHSIILDQSQVLNPTLPVGRVVCTVHWEFKDPNYTDAPAQAVPIQATAVAHVHE